VAVNPIYVESEDEVSGVIERIKGSPGDEVPLVVPSASRFARSRFNFQLLQQYADRLSKRVVIVSPDPAVQQMAQESGLHAIATVPASLLTEGVTAAAVAAPPPFVAGPPSPGGTPPGPAPLPPRPAAASPPPRRYAGPGPGQTPGRAAADLAARVRRAAPKGRSLLADVPPSRLLIYAAAGLVALVVVVASVVYGPSADVVMVATAQPASMDVTLTGDPGRPPITVREVTASKSITQTFNVTSVTPAQPQAARGNVVLDAANCGALAFTIPNGTRLRGPGGIEFATNGGNVDVGAGTPQVQTGIVATQPGPQGNVGQGPFEFENPGAGGCIHIAGGPTQGGATGDQKKVVQQTDLISARNALEQTARQQLTDQLTKSAQDGEKLVADQIQWKPQFQASHKVGDDAGNFSASLVENATAYYYRPDQVHDAMRSAVQHGLPAGKQVAGDLTIADNPVAVGPNGHLTFSAKASYFLAPRLDTDAIRMAVAGRSPADVQRDLQRRYPVRSVEVQQFPFGLPFMPLSSSRVTVRYRVLFGPARQQSG
jgi:hypothetical protein